MAGIDLRGLTKVYPGGYAPCDALDLAIADGEFFALLGPSGCGKTTLLRTIAGLEARLGGTRAHRRARRHRPAARRSGTWRWCSRTTRCSRT